MNVYERHMASEEVERLNGNKMFSDRTIDEFVSECGDDKAMFWEEIDNCYRFPDVDVAHMCTEAGVSRVRELLIGKCSGAEELWRSMKGSLDFGESGIDEFLLGWYGE